MFCMYGQKELTSRINAIPKDKFPHFSIIVGPDGSGKHLLCNQIAKTYSFQSYFAECGVDSVREVIANAYKCTGRPVLYIFADADSMSPAAKNALLKVTEEPPKNAYIIITLRDLNNTYATIRSRGVVFSMDPYSEDEIDNYYHDNFSSYTDERAIVDSICDTPGDVEKVVAFGAVEFMEFVEQVVDSVATVSGSNVFKIAGRIKFKDTDNGYDLPMFWKAFSRVCSSRLTDDPEYYASGIKVTSKYLQELKMVGINKQMCFDMWLLDIREVWMDGHKND